MHAETHAPPGPHPSLGGHVCRTLPLQSTTLCRSSEQREAQPDRASPLPSRWRLGASAPIVTSWPPPPGLPSPAPASFENVDLLEPHAHDAMPASASEP